MAGSLSINTTCQPENPENLDLAAWAYPPSVGGTVGGGGAGTSDVNSLMDDQLSTNILCEPATGNRVVLVVTRTDTGAPAITALNLDGSAYTGAVNALESCAGTGDIEDVVCETMVDDVAGDGTGALTNYVRLVRRTVNGNTGAVTTTVIGNYTDCTAQTAYTVLGTARAGATTVTDQLRFTVTNGATWSPPSGLRSYTLRVETNTSGAITYLDSNGTTTDLAAGEAVSWDADVNGVFHDAPVLTTGTGDVVVVTATQIGGP